MTPQHAPPGGVPIQVLYVHDVGHGLNYVSFNMRLVVLICSQKAHRILAIILSNHTLPPPLCVIDGSRGLRDNH